MMGEKLLLNRFSLDDPDLYLVDCALLEDEPEESEEQRRGICPPASILT